MLDNLRLRPLPHRLHQSPLLPHESPRFMGRRCRHLRDLQMRVMLPPGKVGTQCKGSEGAEKVGQDRVQLAGFYQVSREPFHFVETRLEEALRHCKLQKLQAFLSLGHVSSPVSD